MVLYLQKFQSKNHVYPFRIPTAFVLDIARYPPDGSAEKAIQLILYVTVGPNMERALPRNLQLYSHF